MARRVMTPRKGENLKAWLDRVTELYWTYQMTPGGSLLDFLLQFGVNWRSVHAHGGIGYDGIVRLIRCLPIQWKGWATETAKSFIKCRLPTFNLKGDMEGFLKVMCDGAVNHPTGPLPVPTTYPSSRTMELPPWTFLGCSGGERCEDESSQPSKGKRARADDGESSQSPKGKRVLMETESEDDLDSEEETERYHLLDPEFEAEAYQADDVEEEKEEARERDPREDSTEEDDPMEDSEEDPEEEDPEEEDSEEEDPEEDPEEEDPEEEDPEEEMEVGEPPVAEPIPLLSVGPQLEMPPPIPAPVVEELAPPPHHCGQVIYIDDAPEEPQEQPVWIFIDSDDED